MSGGFIQKYQTTKDNVRFYVEEGLLTPARHGRNYWYSEADGSDFEQIKALQEMGFSIAAIQQIREQHDKHCGTTEQWRFNLNLIERELAGITQQEQELANRRAGLEDLRDQLITRLGDSE